MKADTPLQAPRHLRPATRRWWQAVVSDWTLEAHHVKLLTLACESFDRCCEAREQIRREGLTVPTKAGGPRLHPCVRVEQDTKLMFARLLRELDLDMVPPADSKRPPGLRSIAR